MSRTWPLASARGHLLATRSLETAPSALSTAQSCVGRQAFLPSKANRRAEDEDSRRRPEAADARFMPMPLPRLRSHRGVLPRGSVRGRTSPADQCHCFGPSVPDVRARQGEVARHSPRRSAQPGWPVPERSSFAADVASQSAGTRLSSLCRDVPRAGSDMSSRPQSPLPLDRKLNGALVQGRLARPRALPAFHLARGVSWRKTPPASFPEQWARDDL
jgi:hypothetical protein